MPLSVSALNRLQLQHYTIHELIKGFSEEGLRHRVVPEKWSTFEQIAHLTAYQPAFLARLQKIESADNPTFERYVADNDPVFEECCKKSLKELLDDFDTQRFLIHKHLTSLPEPVLRRIGKHPRFGLLTITDWTEFFLLHEAHHLFSIFMLTRQSLAASQPV
jgi:hypothetical protein